MGSAEASSVTELARVEDWSAQVEAPLTRWFFAETAPARDGERLARNLVEEFVALVRACVGGEVREVFEVEGPALVRGEIFQDVVDAWLFCAASRSPRASGRCP